MADRSLLGTLRFRDVAERAETRIPAARRLVRITKSNLQSVDPQVAADAARLPGQRQAG